MCYLPVWCGSCCQETGTGLAHRRKVGIHLCGSSLLTCGLTATQVRQQGMIQARCTTSLAR